MQKEQEFDVEYLIKELKLQLGGVPFDGAENWQAGYDQAINFVLKTIDLKLKKEPEVEKKYLNCHRCGEKTTSEWALDKIAFHNKCGSSNYIFEEAISSPDDKKVENKNMIDADELINRLNEMPYSAAISDWGHGYNRAANRILEYVKSKLPAPKEEELKACECGGNAEKVMTLESTGTKAYRIRCADLCCFSSTSWFALEAQAIVAWNKRAGDK